MNDLIHVKGLSDLEKLLDQVAPKVARNSLRGALRAGASVIRPVAVANIASKSGVLAKSLKVKTTASGGEVKALVYTRVFYAPFVEFGTQPHRIVPKNRKALAVGGGFAESVDHPGAEPHPFMRPALDTQAGAAVVAAGEYLKRRLATKEGLDTADIDIALEEAE